MYIKSVQHSCLNKCPLNLRSAVNWKGSCSRFWNNHQGVVQFEGVCISLSLTIFLFISLSFSKVYNFHNLNFFLVRLFGLDANKVIANWLSIMTEFSTSFVINCKLLKVSKYFIATFNNQENDYRRANFSLDLAMKRHLTCLRKNVEVIWPLFLFFTSLSFCIEWRNRINEMEPNITLKVKFLTRVFRVILVLSNM